MQDHLIKATLAPTGTNILVDRTIVICVYFQVTKIPEISKWRTNPCSPCILVTVKKCTQPSCQSISCHESLILWIPFCDWRDENVLKLQLVMWNSQPKLASNETSNMFNTESQSFHKNRFLEGANTICYYFYCSSIISVKVITRYLLTVFISLCNISIGFVRTFHTI